MNRREEGRKEERNGGRKERERGVRVDGWM